MTFEMNKNMSNIEHDGNTGWGNGSAHKKPWYVGDKLQVHIKTHRIIAAEHGLNESNENVKPKFQLIMQLQIWSTDIYWLMPTNAFTFHWFQYNWIIHTFVTTPDTKTCLSCLGGLQSILKHNNVFWKFLQKPTLPPKFTALKTRIMMARSNTNVICALFHHSPSPSSQGHNKHLSDG
jgi:hypothetical protein